MGPVLISEFVEGGDLWIGEAGSEDMCDSVRIANPGLSARFCKDVRFVLCMDSGCAGKVGSFPDLRHRGGPQSAWIHPGVELRANFKSISHRCHPVLVAFVWGLTKETILLPLGCLQGGFAARHGRSKLRYPYPGPLALYQSI